MAAAGVDTDPTADYNKVSALYHFDGTNGLINAGFAKDGGTYSGSFSISGGAPYQSEANPFSRPDGCWSVLFDGSDDYITTSDANLALGTGDFTIECWVYFSTTTVAEGLFQLSNGTLNSQVRGPAAGLDGSTGRWGMYHGTTYLVHGSEQPKVGDWYHVAFVRNSSTSKLYVNGVEKLSASDSTDYTDTNWTIGGWYSSSYLFTGYMSNFRIVKGTAVYTSAFTPPTSPLSAITNTQVLACQSHNFK